MSPVKRLAPLNEGGPTQLLNIQIHQLNEENEKLRHRLKTVESQATSSMREYDELKSQIEDLKSAKSEAQTVTAAVDCSQDVEEVSERFFSYSQIRVARGCSFQRIRIM